MDALEHDTPQRPSRNGDKEPPATPLDPDRVSKAYATVAMHSGVMKGGFAGFVAGSFGTTRQALDKRRKNMPDHERKLLFEHGKSVRDTSGVAELPAGSEAWLLPAEQVRLGLAKHALAKEEIRKLPKDAKRRRAVERGELSATLTAKMHADPEGFTSAMAEAEALRQGFSDLDAHLLKRHCREHPGQAPSPAGAPCIFGPVQEEKIVAWVKLMRAMHLQISDESVAAHVAYSIKGTPLHKCFEGGAPSIRWCRAFLKRHSIDLGKRAAAVSELAGEKWCMPSNFERFYTITFETLEAEGIVRKNPLYDRTVPLRWGKNGSNEDDPRVTALCTTLSILCWGPQSQLRRLPTRLDHPSSRPQPPNLAQSLCLW